MVKLAVSILDCKDKIGGVLELNKTIANYIHVDVMDGKFVLGNNFNNIDEIKKISDTSNCPLDMHLMMEDPIMYIEKLVELNIEFVTVHLEIDKDLNSIIEKIHALGYKAGISVKPNTNIDRLKPYLNKIDMILVMSVEPGLGGQSFIESTVDRINELKKLIDKSGRNILIEVDGGINNETITKLEHVDIAVVGSYVVKSDNYKMRIEELFNKLD